jgi:hypothetical protein
MDVANKNPLKPLRPSQQQCPALACCQDEHPRAGTHRFQVEAEFGDENVASVVDC